MKIKQLLDIQKIVEGRAIPYDILEGIEKTKYYSKINKKFDVPLLNENQEAELLGIVHEIIVDVAKDMKK